MKQTIENNIVSISVWTAVSVIISVIGMVWLVADFKAEIKEDNTDFKSELLAEKSKFNTRLSLIEKDSETQKSYLYNLKSDLKADIQENNNKLNDIYDLLIKR